ncbi:hypothetical protein [Niallia circulans]|nr:hypothetical protein [Niallia circulans]
MDKEWSSLQEVMKRLDIDAAEVLRLVEEMDEDDYEVTELYVIEGGLK